MKDRLITIAMSVAATIGVSNLAPERQKELDVDRLIVRKELIVSDTGQPWEKGFEAQQIPRGIYARPWGEEIAGLWVRSRLVKAHIDDPFDDRFHTMNGDGSIARGPGHISWNVWIAGAWRQMAIIQGEGVEFSEVPKERWSGDTHPGRLRFQTFREKHQEPVTDALIGQGMMSIGGGCFGGGGLPYPSEVLQLWGGKIQETSLATPQALKVLKDDGSGKHTYAVVAIGPQGRRTEPSAPITADGFAKLSWNGVVGSDAYLVLRDGADVTGVVRIEGAPQWSDPELK